MMQWAVMLSGDFSQRKCPGGIFGGGAYVQWKVLCLGIFYMAYFFTGEYPRWNDWALLSDLHTGLQSLHVANMT